MKVSCSSARKVSLDKMKLESVMAFHFLFFGFLIKLTTLGVQYTELNYKIIMRQVASVCDMNSLHHQK